MDPASKPELRLGDLAKAIAHARAEVVIVGGVSMILLGGDYLTRDLDLCYRREPETVARLCEALAPYSPLLRSAFLDVQNTLLSQEASYSLDTEFGPVDLMVSLTGIGDYEQVLALAEPVPVDEETVMVLSVDGLIQNKEAIGRDKDKLHLMSLRALKALKEE